MDLDITLLFSCFRWTAKHDRLLETYNQIVARPCGENNEALHWTIQVFRDMPALRSVINLASRWTAPTSRLKQEPCNDDDCTVRLCSSCSIDRC